MKIIIFCLITTFTLAQSVNEQTENTPEQGQIEAIPEEPVEMVPLKGRLPGIKIDYQNSILLEQIMRQRLKTRKPIDNFQLTVKCYKKWPVRGRSEVKTYQCDPVEVEKP